MLHCSDRSFYVGHTDDLEYRLAQHEQGALGGHTATRRPVKLVWCSDFPTRYEALAAERQIKGWSRAKKLALIREDWDRISALARSRRQKKERASTSSARTEEGGSLLSLLTSTPLPPRPVRPEPVEGLPFSSGATRLRLKPCPGTICEAVSSIDVEVFRPDASTLELRYLLAGNIAGLQMPPPAAPARTDELWRHTCFEAFLRTSGEGYFEFNLSPSNEWAAYRFTGYREGMQSLETRPPHIETCFGDDRFELLATLSLPASSSVRLALSAVIEEFDGTKSYWALSHPTAKPDFHHPDSFILELP